MRRVDIGLFAEDDGHESLVGGLIERVAAEEDLSASVFVRSAHGGFGPAIRKLKSYVRDQTSGLENFHEILVVATDANCRGARDRQSSIRAAVGDSYAGSVVAATPEPHVEFWYLADPHAIGVIADSAYVADVPPRKCERSRYKRALKRALEEAGCPTIAGGVEYGRDIAAAMDLDVASRTSDELREFITELRREFIRIRSQEAN